MPAFASPPIPPDVKGKATLRPVDFRDLAGWRRDNHLQSWSVFLENCRAITDAAKPLRAGLPAGAALQAACRAALGKPTPQSRGEARVYFESLFQPHEILPIAGQNPYDRGFLTGYYEPVVDGSLTRSEKFREPVLPRPDDLVTLAPETSPKDFPAGLTSARRRPDGSLEPYAVRADIENGIAPQSPPPILWVRDGIELFMMQVQGSARIRLENGELLRLTYAGRNGQPYTSIGRLLVERGHVPKDEMSLARLKAWVRENGQKQGEAGRLLMQENRSYVFFAIDRTLDADRGPVGAASIPLTPLRSIAVDRALWPYGLPMWIDGTLPWQSSELRPFRRLMIAQDTGSAILGAARADLFFGTGARAGRLAGGIRHTARMFVLLPKDGDAGQ